MEVHSYADDEEIMSVGEEGLVNMLNVTWNFVRLNETWIERVKDVDEGLSVALIDVAEVGPIEAKAVIVFFNMTVNMSVKRVRGITFF